MNLDDIQNVFFVECEESLEAAEAGLETCKAGEHDTETINAIFRGVHSIKGGAGAFGHAPLQAFTHCFETLLADVREDAVELTPELVDLLLHALDCLRDHVDAAREGRDPPNDADLIKQLTEAQAANGGAAGTEGDAEESDEPTATAEQGPDSSDDGLDLDALLDDLDADAGDGESGDAAQADAALPICVHLRPHAPSMINGGDPLLWLRELELLGGKVAKCDTSFVPQLDDFDPATGYLGWSFEVPVEAGEEAVTDIFDFAGDGCSLVIGEGEAIPEPQLGEGQSDATEQSDASAKQADTDGEAEEPSETDAKAEDTDKVDAPAKSAQTPVAKQAAPANQAARQSREGQSIRIDLAKLDRLIDGVSELVIAQAMLAQRLSADDVTHCEELTMLDGLIRDMQERAMAIRAQPIGTVFNRIPRVLRELANSTGKHVKLELVGESTELDKTVIEMLSEPMTHLIRNAVDHGIESAEERLAAGKSADGTLLLQAEHRGGRIVIRIEDDGKGINREVVFAKALEKGLVTEDQQLSDEEIDNLIFAPGFSTAQQVSNISGRGVGMDVVRQHVKELGGRITIESQPGKGTAFILALPLTLAISDGMIVQVAGQSLVIPLAHVVESLRPTADQIKGMGTDRQMLNVRETFVPIMPLAGFVGSGSGPAQPTDGVLVIVETENSGQAALLVDEITDQRQFVIKSLDTHYRSIEGVAGATILGNGQVALIVDVDRLVQEAASSSVMPNTPAEVVAA